MLHIFAVHVNVNEVKQENRHPPTALGCVNVLFFRYRQFSLVFDTQQIPVARLLELMPE